MSDLEQQITELWEHRDDISAVMPEAEAPRVHMPRSTCSTPGEARVAEVVDDEVVVHQWLKQAILLLFRLTKMTTIELGPFEFRDKIPLKRDYEKAGVRVVPGAQARWGSYLAPGVIMMPSYVNIGAYVGDEHDGRHLGDGRLVRADRGERPPLRWRRHRRRARAAGAVADHGR